MRLTLLSLWLPVLLLSACDDADKDGRLNDGGSENVEPVGSYDIDPASGEVRATHTDVGGVTTTMRAGKDVPPDLPEPFLLYPGAQVTGTTRVDQGDGAFVTLDFTTSDERARVVEYYREQALEAGIDPEVEIRGTNATTLGGENRGEGISFTLSVTREASVTEAQLSVARGFE